MPSEPDQAPALRRIIHVDMDAFYASVEQRDDPRLRGVPLAVGGSSERGVVAAASYEARRFGVHSAMPSVIARRRCPDLVFVRPRFDVYKAVSAHAIAAEIRAAIRHETGLTASAGVSYNKFLAKLASDHRKPDGLFVITPRMGPGFVETLPVGKFHGIGPVTAARMQALGIHTGLDLRQQSRAFLAQHFGKAGDYLYGVARGVDDRPVQADRVRKSVGAETTFERDLLRWDEVAPALDPVFAKVWDACRRGGHAGRTVTVKLKYADFQLVTRSRSNDAPVATQAALEQISYELLRPLFPLPRGVRLLGVTLSNLEAEVRSAPAQLALGLG